MKKTPKKKIYVGAAYTYANYEFRLKVEKFKDRLRKKFEIMDFNWLTDKVPADSYELSVKYLNDCDLFIAICDYPSLGLGYEMGCAVKMNKKVLALAHKNSTVSMLILKINKKHKNFILKRYSNSLTELTSFIVDAA
ncbi:MAG: hypothetical protein A3G52_03675 [Candidatus Taylorbacteria bacterium RIFCSPLOWO2_12_FULL_43_20]|uniref:Nucleoside 2-deoxyribosyltransferase n=1 Tax=Candidatus Taylorbacteria bacterium RIFCSPLOWO2_12_FULL_43_20 TaxID=1802332 RepID=A0A1G2NZF3_9BACT|nr:MAG: hypothetical protein A2825_01520 [Candidatus Taylorbacteria bacterium RIFCSPHIGHO2_01_FULL_43_120]OHA22186.1 MAG: hypothetical protein A3B98_01785 [Candidatus Taylorbacteria bacterium RIFCSPHIGHO2_02_FULL_43_55]OHA28036.1 MAG: hypothetical protein A3E92_04885 [Candidatus Taylorbacteria bacterium RIFCSPHIGHO2_12_FULL_42_34]OHA32269.1 MAG: hypothetical protein A3B09_02100 [Candidatus Taylorbacteria bacterium RIFCSPLOWO2_01_FULL_43_83]OHA37862.1 MAG: hypothetical protein A3H58_02130 [Candi